MSHAARPLATLATIASLLLAAEGSAQWSSDAAANLAIVSKSGEQVLPKIAATPDGGCWVGWFDSSAGSYDVYAQRLDAAGVRQFPAGGLLVSDHAQSTSLVDWDLAADADGNAILVFTDTRDGGDLDVFACKLSPFGAMLWGADGIQLSTNNDYEPSPKVCVASDGDLVFVWARLPSSGDGGLRMQRLSPAGVPKLIPGGKLIVTQANEDPAFCSIVPADAGAVIVSWVRDITTFASPRHVRARKFSDTAAPLWPVVAVYDAGPVPIAHLPGLADDGTGGALLWWHSSDLSGNFSSFVQHLDAAGAEVFPHNGVSVATAAGRGHFDPTLAYPQPGGDLYVFWNERNSNQSQWGIYGQRLTAAGALQWGAGGLALIPVNTVYKGPPRALPYAGGAGVFCAEEPTGLFGKDRVLGLRVDAAGTKLWAGGMTVAASTLSTKSRLPVAIDCAGNARLVWEDDRNGTPDLYAQSLRPDGTLGAGFSAWTDLGSSLAGTHGAPLLVGSGLPCSGGSVTLALTNARENSSAWLLIGFSLANVPFKGGVLVPTPDLVIASLPTGLAGALTLLAAWPAAVPAGLAVYFQDWILDPLAVQGVAATNGVQVIAQ